VAANRKVLSLVFLLSAVPIDLHAQEYALAFNTAAALARCSPISRSITTHRFQPTANG
jgi:hypothetical protein